MNSFCINEHMLTLMESARPTWGIPLLPTLVATSSVVLAEAEGAEPSGSLAVTVVFVVVENVKVKFVGESPCEQFFVLMNTSVLSL